MDTGVGRTRDAGYGMLEIATDLHGEQPSPLRLPTSGLHPSLPSDICVHLRHLRITHLCLSVCICGSKNLRPIEGTEARSVVPPSFGRRCDPSFLPLTPATAPPADRTHVARCSCAGVASGRGSRVVFAQSRQALAANAPSLGRSSDATRPGHRRWSQRSTGAPALTSGRPPACHRISPRRCRQWRRSTSLVASTTAGTDDGVAGERRRDDLDGPRSYSGVGMR